MGRPLFRIDFIMEFILAVTVFTDPGTAFGKVIERFPADFAGRAFPVEFRQGCFRFAHFFDSVSINDW